MRIVALRRTNFSDLAPFAEDDAGFLGLEVDGATLMTRRQQHLIQGVELLEVRQHLLVLATQRLAFSALRLLQHGADLVVGQTRMGMNHRFIELIVDDLAGLGDAHLADHGQTIDVRIQRAETVGKLLRQHGHHALGEIHRVATPGRFFIQRRTDLDVVRHVGDRHIEFPAAGKQLPATAILLAEHRIVEVAGIFAIDGNERQMTQIDAFLLVLLLDFRLELVRFLDDCIRPDMRDVVAAQRHVDLHARRHVVADHFDDVALRLET